MGRTYDTFYDTLPQYEDLQPPPNRSRLRGLLGAVASAGFAVLVVVNVVLVCAYVTELIATPSPEMPIE